MLSIQTRVMMNEYTNSSDEHEEESDGDYTSDDEDTEDVDFDEDIANREEDDGGIKYVNEGQQPCRIIIC